MTKIPARTMRGVAISAVLALSFPIITSATETGTQFLGISDDGQILISNTNSGKSSATQGIRQGGVRGIRQGGVRGIRQGGVRGIRQGGVRGIRQGGVRGIRQGGVRGIRQGGVRGIRQGGVRGIRQGGVRGIRQGGVRGIRQGGVRGIRQGGVRGIRQGGVRGIRQGGVRGIRQGGVRGIRQGGVRGIRQGGVRGIRQGGVRGIRQGGVRGIRQGGVRGIRQGGVRGIRQGGVRGIRQGGVRGIRQGGVRGTPAGLDLSSNPIPLLAIGPVGSTQQAGIEVFGQEVVADEQTIIIDLASGTQISVDDIESGSFVLVAGDIVEPGKQLATVITVLKGTFVGGADSIYLRAQVSAVTHGTGMASSGSTSIDFSPSLYNNGLTTLESDDIVEFFGNTNNDWRQIQALEGQIL